jgi:hypothetical protein
MKQEPLDSRSKEKPAPRHTRALEHPGDLVPTSDHMATTLSRHTAPYAIQSSPYDFRPQLPPVVPAALRVSVPTTAFSRTSEASTISLHPSAAWPSGREPHVYNQPTFFGDNNVSTGQPRRFSGEDSSTDGTSMSGRRVRRRGGAPAPHRYQSSRRIRKIKAERSPAFKM